MASATSMAVKRSRWAKGLARQPIARCLASAGQKAVANRTAMPRSCAICATSMPLRVPVNRMSVTTRSTFVLLIASSACEQQFTVSTRSEEHTSELKSLMRNSYDVFCLKKTINEHYITDLSENNIYQN